MGYSPPPPPIPPLHTQYNIESKEKFQALVNYLEWVEEAGQGRLEG